MERIIKATMLAGLLPGLVSPIIWPAVVLFVEGRWPTWSVYPMAALTISFFAIIIALPCCVIFGSPALVGLEKIKLNKSAIAGATGFIIALVVYFLLAVSNNFSSLSPSWPLAAFFAANGAICAAVASSLSRTNKRVKADAQKTRVSYP